MSQFDYLGTWIDSWELLGAILEPGDVRFVPDLWYVRPETPFFTQVDDRLKECLVNGNHRVFIWGKSFSKFPPVLERMGEGGPLEGMYSVDFSAGGPCLSLSLPGSYQHEGLLNLGPGMLSFQTLTLNPETGKREKPTDALKAGYRMILGRMKQSLVRHELHVPIWMGRNALRLLEEKKARVTGFEGKTKLSV